MQTVIAKAHPDEAGELRGLFEKQLAELYWAEGIMQNMLKGAIIQSSSSDLVRVLQQHLRETVAQRERLLNIFIDIGVPAHELPYESIACLVKEAEDFIKATRQGVVRDAGSIALIQKIKHYEIACYGTMRAYALALREEGVVTLLEQTLEEEKATDALLSAIAISHINTEAADKEI